MSARADAVLDVAAVHAWLVERVAGLNGPPEVTRYEGGASNWTYRLRYPDRDLVLRRPPAGTRAKSAHDMSREYRVQEALRPRFPSVPRMVALCDVESVIGVPFYVMERVDGLIPRASMPERLRLDETGNRALSTAAIEKLAELHAVAPATVGLDSLGRGPGYPRRQVEGWSDRYLRARTWNVPRFNAVREWLHAHVPVDSAACIIHNDWRLDNLVMDRGAPTRIVGVLDWEMATVGDPLMDLGNALAYWVQADDDLVMRLMRRQPTHLPGMLRRDEVVDLYLARSGLSVASWSFYEVQGLFRLAVIAQQIYYRYHHRQTRNPAFRHLWLLVHYLERRCLRVIRRAG